MIEWLISAAYLLGIVAALGGFLYLLAWAQKNSDHNYLAMWIELIIIGGLSLALFIILVSLFHSARMGT